jgi:hypothetical protein
MPASWEILEARRNRVLITTIYPADGKVSMEWTSAMAHLQVKPDWQVMNPSGFPYHVARNAGVKVALDNKFGWLFFLDSDVVPPVDIIMKLLASGRDLVGAVYRQRYPPYRIAAFTTAPNPNPDDPSPAMGPLPPHAPGDIIPVDFLAAGATLISRRCLEAVVAEWPRPYDWAVDPMGQVPDGKGGFLPRMSEDYLFSWRAKLLGYQPWLHTGIECFHELMMRVGPHGPEPPQAQQNAL